VPRCAVMAPSEGDVATVERPFTPDDVERFADLSRDRGDHHLGPDNEGGAVMTAEHAGVVRKPAGGTDTGL
jgi:hypothetical protein